MRSGHTSRAGLKKKAWTCPELPVTADDVKAIWKQASKKGPCPHNISCGAFASHLTHCANDAESLNDQYKTDVIHSILRIEDYILPIMLQCHGFESLDREFYDDNYYRTTDCVTYPRLRHLVEELEWFKDCCKLSALDISTPFSMPRTPSWTQAAIPMWKQVKGLLQSLGGKAGTARNSVAVRVTAFSLNRIGFASATPTAVAKVITRWAKAKPTLEMTPNARTI